jgi:hypothetical protein
MKRTLLSLALVLPLIEPLGLFAKAVRAEGHECRDHVCMCARRCPPKKRAQEPCHGDAGARPTVRSACNHDQAGALGSVTPAVVPAEARRAVVPVFEFELSSVVGGMPSGFGEIDPPPPRAL